MKEDVIQCSFTGGEFAPSLLGRTTIAQYANATTELENFLIRPYGSALSCPGTEYISDAKYTVSYASSGNLVLYMKFETDFSDSSSYNHTPNVSGATIDNSTYIVGAGSGKFDKTNSECVYFNHDSLFDFGSNDFEIGFYFKLQSQLVFGSNLTMLSLGNPGTGQGGFYFYLYGDTFGEEDVLNFLMSRSVGSPTVFGLDYRCPTKLNTTDWYKIKIKRVSNDIKMYFNDNVVDSITVTNTTIAQNTDNPLIVGGLLNDATQQIGVNFTNSYLDELYIINGIGDIENQGANIYGKAKLFPFIFSRTDSSIIELGETYFRFYTNGAQVQA